MSDDPVQDLVDYANEQIDEISDELGMERVEVEAALRQIRQDAAAAAQAQDQDHIASLAYEVPAVLTRSAVRVRAANRRRAYEMLGKIMEALFSLIAKTVAPVLLCLLLLLPGCILRRNTVPSDGVRGLVGEVCEVSEQCAMDGRGEFMAQCDPIEPGSLTNVLLNEKTIDGTHMLMAVTEVCDSVQACILRWPELPDYKRNSYTRWCTVLRETAAAAVAE